MKPANALEKRLLDDIITGLSKGYDPQVCMLKRAQSLSYNYHTNRRGGYVHPVRDSLKYAVTLLDSEQDNLVARAVKIIEQVLSLQDTDTDSWTYGIWPYHYEEPLEEMGAPDFNWADFCGKKLLYALIIHGEKFDSLLYDEIRQSVYHACCAIKKRDIKPDYTNISIMGAYVTLIYGELFEDEEFLLYGKQRLQDLYMYNRHHGAFTEYNSPTYNLVAIRDLGAMFDFVKDEESLQMIEYLYKEFGWKSIARHFHFPTGQWAGPHSRCYANLLPKRLWADLKLAIHGEIQSEDEYELYSHMRWPLTRLSCPAEFIPYFRAFMGERFEKTVYHLEDHRMRTLIASSYLTEKFTFGSLFQEELWIQRRPLIAYWGGDNPAYMQFKCLHDNYDYSSAVIHTIQEKGDLLGIVNFATDGGDKHRTLDKVIDKTITATDLRCRFEFGGAIDDLHVEKMVEDNVCTFYCTTNDIHIKITIPYVRFYDRTEFDVTDLGQNKGLDIILHSGAERKIDFGSLQKAVCAVTVSIASKTDILPDAGTIAVSENEDELELSWDIKTSLLEVTAGLTPDEFANVYKKGRARSEILSAHM